MNTDRILTLLGEVLETDDQTLLDFPQNTPLQELGLNSIRFIQFIVAFEETFDLEVRDSDLLFTNFRDLETLFAALEKHLNNTAVQKKVLVCDCDNVLWRGIAGEESLRLNDVVKTLLPHRFSPGS